MTMAIFTISDRCETQNAEPYTKRRALEVRERANEGRVEVGRGRRHESTNSKQRTTEQKTAAGSAHHTAVDVERETE